MGHTIFITVHAIAAGIALLAGGVAIARRALFRTYLWSLVTMEVFLVLAIAEEWGVIDVATRVLFTAFAALGLYMVWRGDQARRIQPSGSAGPSASYIGHVGFTLIALFDAFIVILVLDLGAPGWLVAAGGVLIAVAGHFALRAVRERLVDPTAASEESRCARGPRQPGSGPRDASPATRSHDRAAGATGEGSSGGDRPGAPCRPSCAR